MICCGFLDRIVDSIFVLGEKLVARIDGISKQQATIERFSTQLLARSQLSHSQTLKDNLSKLLEMMEDLSKPFDHISHVSEQTYDIVRDTADNNLIGWISDVPYGKHHAQIQKSVMANTGR